MNPDVVGAIDALVKQGVVDRRSAVAFRREASGSLVSVREELRVVLWFGVLAITTGVGLLVRQNLDRIGPVAIAFALTLGSVGCLVWAWRRASTRSLAFDSVLLLGALLAAADLAFIEVKFSPLGAEWPWHLAIVAAFYAALALRFDSKTLFSLALTSFAAWRGVSIAGVARPWGGVTDSDRLFVEALGCGVLFIALAKVFERGRVRAEFEPVAAWLGWLLLAGALTLRLGVDEGRATTAAALVGCGALLAWFAWDERSVGRYALGIGTAAVGVSGWSIDAIDRIGGGETLVLMVIVLLAVGVIALVLRGHRALRGPS